MAFDPKQHFIRLQGRDYLPVAARIAWMRDTFPDWGIVTEAIELDFANGLAIFKASLFNEEGNLMATAHKTETRKGFPDFVEKAEAGAIGRAIAYIGLGTLNAQELDEGEQRIADTPQPPRQRKQPAPLAEPKPERTPVQQAAYDFYKEAVSRNLIPRDLTKDGATKATKTLVAELGKWAKIDDEEFDDTQLTHWQTVTSLLAEYAAVLHSNDG